METDQNYKYIKTGVSYSILHKGDEDRRPSLTSLDHYREEIYNSF